MTTANIRDRRTWARGARAYINLSALSIGASGVTALSGTSTRLELSGTPIEGGISGVTSTTVANAYGAVYLYKDGVSWFFVSIPMANTSDQYPGTGIQFEGTPTAGSHVYDLRTSVPRTSLNWNSGEMRFFLREQVGGFNGNN
jgi:hypothetical protein